MYSVGNHHPDEYDDVFGSLDAALVEAGLADTDTAKSVTTSQSEPDSDRDELITELQELASNRHRINQNLLYSVGDHHLEEYQDVFGSFDVALVEAGIADPDTVEAANKEQSTPSDKHGELITELQELAEDWDTIDRKLLYSVGSHHPDEYDDAFGSLDAALDKAGVADRGTEDTDQDTANTDSTDQSIPTDEREELLAELRELAEDWDTIDRKLLYSVGDHHPDEYDDAFGSVDAALDAAGVTDTIPTAADTVAETDENPTDTIPARTTGEQPQSADSSIMTDLPANELAELYVAFDRFQHLLTELAGELDTDDTTPMECWADAVADHWGEDGPDGAPNYGLQQRNRNSFIISDYHDAHGDGDRVTNFNHVDFAAVDNRIQHLVGDAIDDWEHAVPIAPESNTPLPVAIASTDALDTAIELLDEFPAYPDADRPAPADTDMSPDSPTLPDGRVDTLTVTVLTHDANPGSKRDARLQVELTDGTELPLKIWSTHTASSVWFTVIKRGYAAVDVID